ncbi:hydroxyethylthiazole kinase [Thalassobaculum sp.]|uniref:hydroxyethylthiazole kinase n=1 Tax=Thalassobaculum sp. TaxID=2022740 RepID=UPI003B5CCB48
MKSAGMHLKTLRDTAPLVQNITNFVAMNVVANAQLAVGASPAMVHAIEEAAEFAGIAGGLTVNIGTADAGWEASMVAAAQAASAAGKPWVLDPVAVGATGFRNRLAARLLALNPTVLRGNASEILALSGEVASGKGVDAGDPVAAAEDAARYLAQRTGGVVAVSGAVDFVTNGDRAMRIAGGSPLMGRVTAMGCALTGVVGAFLVGQDPFAATVAAHACFGRAGEIAADRADGPGSFGPALMDALSEMTPEQLDAEARIEAV